MTNVVAPLTLFVIKVTAAHGLSDTELEQVLPAYDAVVVRSANQITRNMLVASPRVAIVGRAGSGVDNIDLKAASELGVPVVNAPTGNSGSVAGQPPRIQHGKRLADRYLLESLAPVFSVASRRCHR